MDFNKITRVLYKGAFLAKKNAPTIMTIAGVAGAAVAGVLAARAGAKGSSGVEDAKQELIVIDLHKSEGRFDYRNQKDMQRAIAAYVAYGKETAKQYAVPLVLGTVSLGAVLYAHGLMRARNAALLAAYASLERSFAIYREKVKAISPDADKEIASGFTTVEDPESKDTQAYIDTAAAHLYTRVFDEGNREFGTDGPEYNLYWLKVKENIWNDKLQSRGHIFLNEILDDLGFDHTPEGAITGWLVKGDGDGYIDFGLDAINKDTRMFRGYLDDSLLLEFNVDGVIHDKI